MLMLQHLLLFAFLLLVVGQEFEPKDYCVPEESCWPPRDVFDQLGKDRTTMEIVLPGDEAWSEASDLVLNRKVAEPIGATIFATTTEDVIGAVEFAKEHNINIKAISSGHEFIGRNTAPGALQLSVSRMDSVTADLNCPEHSTGCLTVGPGVWWIKAYKVADDVDRVILGGAEPSVSVTGWALGGGHSPFSPKIGLGVDQILEITMVLADLSVVTLNKDGTSKLHRSGTITTSNDTDLFWAVRGGGGNTFGIVTSIKYKLHLPPSSFTIKVCNFGDAENPASAMKEIKKEMAPVVKNLPEEFGGYLLTGAVCYVNDPCKMGVYATYIFTHMGAESENQESFDRIESTASFLSKYQHTGPCNTLVYDTFYDYNKVQPNVTYQSLDLGGAFLSSSEYTDNFIDGEAEIFEAAFNSQKSFLATWILLGGQTKNDSSGATAINPLFRNAMWSIGYGSSDEGLNKKFVELIGKTVAKKAQYYSECDEDLPPGEWQEQFWGDSYSQLLSIKRKYDTDNHFTCRQCVGSSAGSISLSLVFISFTILLL